MKKLKEFIQRELDKKNKMDEEVKKLEQRTADLSSTRSELFKQLSEMEKLQDQKKAERNELRSKVLIKRAELEEKQKDLADRE